MNKIYFLIFIMIFSFNILAYENKRDIIDNFFKIAKIKEYSDFFIYSFKTVRLQNNKKQAKLDKYIDSIIKNENIYLNIKDEFYSRISKKEMIKVLNWFSSLTGKKFIRVKKNNTNFNNILKIIELKKKKNLKLYSNERKKIIKDINNVFEKPYSDLNNKLINKLSKNSESYFGVDISEELKEYFKESLNFNIDSEENKNSNIKQKEELVELYKYRNFKTEELYNLYDFLSSSLFSRIQKIYFKVLSKSFENIVIGIIKKIEK